MGDYGVGEVGTEASEQVHRLGPIAGTGASGGGRFMGAETGVNNEVAELPLLLLRALTIL